MVKIEQKNFNIALICPSNEGWGESATRGIYYHGGILAVGSRVKDVMPQWNVTLIDGELCKISELEQRLQNADFHILGLSTNTNNYQNCLKLAQLGKENGATIVLGGPHATAVPIQVLKNRPYIDAIIVHDGESAFLEYLIRCSQNSLDFSNIRNLFWRASGKEIKSNRVTLPTEPPRFDELDFSLFPLHSYWIEHKKEFPDISEKFIQGFTHIGCTWRSRSGGCKFCDIPYPQNNYVPPGRFWRDIRNVQRELEIESMKDYGDCLTGNAERVRALLDARPKDLENFEFSCYARSKEVNEEMADMLRDLNVRYAYVGFDSGSNRMLQSMRQGYSVSHNYEAAERLTQRGINITGSLIVGSAEETEETLVETETFAHKLIKNFRVTQLHCSILNVTPGSPYGTQLRQKYPSLFQEDTWDILETSKLWIKNFCSTSYEAIAATAKRINALNPSKKRTGRLRYFGFTKGGEKHERQSIC